MSPNPSEQHITDLSLTDAAATCEVAPGFSKPARGTSHLKGGVAVRMADAMRRGALCCDSVLGVDSIDYLRLDWFALAEVPVSEVRRRVGIPDKSPEA